MQNLHITLAFLGNVSAARAQQVRHAIRSASGPGFELWLDQVQYRNRGGMVWMRANVVPPALAQCVLRLRTALLALEFTVEDRAFIPHITLLRDARRPARLPEIAPAAWLVSEVTLVRSILERSGARYEIDLRVPLTV